MDKKWAVGIDIGSVATKGVLYDGRGWIEAMVLTGWSPRQAGREVLEQLLSRSGLRENQVDMIVGTGYGRVNLDFAGRSASEITCHARGASFLFPQTRGVIDIGGQDSKIIAVDGDGRVRDFVLNDKCAAGTGRFLQVMAQALGMEISQLGEGAKGVVPAEIASMCAVFAESEVIGLLAQGLSKERIAAGILLSIARRMGSMAGKLKLEGRVIFCGGVAHNHALREMLASETGWVLETPAKPQYTGALGAAVIGYELL